MAEHESRMVSDMAQRYNLSPEEFRRVIKATCGLQKATDEEFLAFLMIAHEHKLNPITKEIYAFVKSPERGGGIQPIIGVDGWYKKANEHPAHNGIQFRDEIQGGQLVAVTAIVHRKDRTHPTEATEYMKECRRNSDPWKQWPARMLRHKAAIQAIRIAYNLAGIMDPDEAERYMEMLKNSQAIDVTPDDLPLPSLGRVIPKTDAAAEGTAHTPSPHDEAPKKEQPVAPPSPPIEPEPVEMVSPDTLQELSKYADFAGLNYAKLLEHAQRTYQVEALNELTKSQAADLIAELKRRNKPRR